MNKLLACLGALIVALASMFLAGRKSGKDAARADSAESAVKDARRANEIDQDIARLSDAELDDRLRNTRH